MFRGRAIEPSSEDGDAKGSAEPSPGESFLFPPGAANHHTVAHGVRIPLLGAEKRKFKLSLSLVRQPPRSPTPTSNSLVPPVPTRTGRRSSLKDDSYTQSSTYLRQDGYLQPTIEGVQTRATAELTGAPTTPGIGSRVGKCIRKVASQLSSRTRRNSKGVRETKTTEPTADALLPSYDSPVASADKTLLHFGPTSHTAAASWEARVNAWQRPENQRQSLCLGVQKDTYLDSYLFPPKSRRNAVFRSNSSDELVGFDERNFHSLQSRPQSPAFPFPRMPISSARSEPPAEPLPTHRKSYPDVTPIRKVRSVIHRLPSDVTRAFGVVPATISPPIPQSRLYRPRKSIVSLASSFGSTASSYSLGPRKASCLQHRASTPTISSVSQPPLDLNISFVHPVTTVTPYRYPPQSRFSDSTTTSEKPRATSSLLSLPREPVPAPSPTNLSSHFSDDTPSSKGTLSSKGTPSANLEPTSYFSLDDIEKAKSMSSSGRADFRREEDLERLEEGSESPTKITLTNSVRIEEAIECRAENEQGQTPPSSGSGESSSTSTASSTFISRTSSSNSTASSIEETEIWIDQMLEEQAEMLKSLEQAAN
ncbi:hypothetical protein P7C70_g6744, partial [Phenoliferia sp. Uapishka_3]